MPAVGLCLKVGCRYGPEAPETAAAVGQLATAQVDYLLVWPANTEDAISDLPVSESSAFLEIYAVTSDGLEFDRVVEGSHG